MSARLYSHEAVLKLLAPYKCRRKFKLDGFELWETGWGFGFTMLPEPPQMYSQEQVTRAVVVVAQTMPDDWDPNGKA